MLILLPTTLGSKVSTGRSRSPLLIEEYLMVHEELIATAGYGESLATEGSTGKLEHSGLSKTGRSWCKTRRGGGRRKPTQWRGGAEEEENPSWRSNSRAVRHNNVVLYHNPFKKLNFIPLYAAPAF
jgi:hypothetical protein